MAATPRRRLLEPTAHTSDAEYQLLPDMEYAFTLNGAGFWQMWDGAAWLTYEESADNTEAFVAYPPPSGRVNLSVTSGTVTAGFRMINPGGKSRLGS